MLTLRPLAFVALVLAGGLLGACAESRTSPDFMGNTNWLSPCDGDAECGPGLQCSCGLCTRECQRQAECGGLAQAVCDSNSDAFELACGQAEIGVCLPHCAQPGDCAADQQCVDSRCLPEQVAVGTVDAGPCEAGSCAQDAGIDARTVDAPDSSFPRRATPMSRPTPTRCRSTPRCQPPAKAESDGAPDSAVPDSTVPNPPAPCGAGFVCETAFETQGAIKDVAVGPSHLYLADWGTSDALGNHNGDGALLRWPGPGNEAEVVRDHLDRPWRVWPGVDELYWLGGEFGDFGSGPGPQTLFYLPFAAGAESEAIRTDAFVHVHVDVQGSAAYWLANGGLRLNAIAREGGVWSAVGGRDLDPAVAMIAGVDASYVYFEAFNNTGGLRRMSRGGMELDTVAIASGIFLATVRSDSVLVHPYRQPAARLVFLRAKGRRRADPCSGRYRLLRPAAAGQQRGLVRDRRAEHGQLAAMVRAQGGRRARAGPHLPDRTRAHPRGRALSGMGRSR